MRFSIPPAAAACLLALAACPKSSTESPDAGSAYLTADEFSTAVQTYGTAMCDYLKKCNEMDQAQYSQCTLPDHSLDKTVAAVKAGRLLIPRDGWKGCQDAINALTCDYVSARAMEAACTDVQVANASKGDPCFQTEDCKAGLLCVGKGCAKVCQDHDGFAKPNETCRYPADCDSTLGYCDQVGHTCMALVSDGEACSGSDQCKPASFCDFTLSKCAPRAKVGEACSEGNFDQCPSNAFCLVAGDGGMAGVCTGLLAEGAACDPSGFAQCGTVHTDQGEEPLKCSTAARKCVRYQVKTGDACYLDQGCESDSYCKGASGTTQGTCTAPTVANQGQACSTQTPLAIVCNVGLWCEALSGTCKPKSSSGGPCVDHRGCKDYLECSGTTCASPVPAGSSCANDVPCERPNVCDLTTTLCTALEAVGAACTYDDDCASFNCAVTACADACN